MEYLEKNHGLNVHVCSEVFPAYQLENYLTRSIKKADNHRNYKFKDAAGVSFKDRIANSRAKEYRYNHF